ncbi:hypothetical protein [Methylorubrum podarium]|uniref:hypothetical protein n=1 Tax=Methylorubrum podarium TaxID=200476 RepID=UPI001EE1720C|nr:hypothetical protein [Methylorubrum podarium]GJE71584.1 hypothetical protein CHKEEEPN_3131 [Methylorubrum podarium]
MKTVFVTATALLMLCIAPALAMSCCGGAKGKGAMMCGKGGMAMNHAKKSKTGGCCCNGTSGGNMSKRT